MIDFSKLNVHAVTVTGESRKQSLFGTACALLANVTGLQWHIAYQYSPDEADVEALRRLATATGNFVYVNISNPAYAVAESKAKLIRYLPEEAMIFNVDDDHIFPASTLQQLHKVLETGRVGEDLGVITCSAVDVTNVHGYADWSNEMRSGNTLSKFVAEFGVCSAAHQKWDFEEPVLLRTDYISNGWIVHRSFFDLQSIDGMTILEYMNEWSRGVRGYDCMMQYFLRKEGVPIHLVVGAYIEHIGMSTSGWNASLDGHSEYYQDQVVNRLKTKVISHVDLIRI